MMAQHLGRGTEAMTSNLGVGAVTVQILLGACSQVCLYNPRSPASPRGAPPFSLGTPFPIWATLGLELLW